MKAQEEFDVVVLNNKQVTYLQGAWKEATIKVKYPFTAPFLQRSYSVNRKNKTYVIGLKQDLYQLLDFINGLGITINYEYFSPIKEREEIIEKFVRVKEVQPEKLCKYIIFKYKEEENTFIVMYCIQQALSIKC